MISFTDYVARPQSKKKSPKIKIKEDTQRQGASGKWSACPSKRVIIPGFLIAAGTRSREEKKERGLGGRNLLRSERAAWAGTPGERHRNVRSDSIWQGVPTVVSRPLSPESARISRGPGSSCALCHAVCGGTTHAVGSKGCGTLRASGPPPLHCAAPLNPPALPPITTVTTISTTTTIVTCPWRRPELVVETSPGVILSA